MYDYKNERIDGVSKEVLHWFLSINKFQWLGIPGEDDKAEEVELEIEEFEE